MVAIFLLIECYQGVMEQSALGATAQSPHATDNKQGSHNDIQVEAISKEDDI